MFKNSIPGLEKLFKNDHDIQSNSVILVSGSEGALKSGFVFHIISNYLEESKERGLYATLEENEESLFKNMKSFGIKKSEDLHVFDYKDLRTEWDKEELDIIKVTENLINFYKEKNNLTVFALDSLNALYSVSSHINRKKLYHFFSVLRDKNLTSFLILEKCSLNSNKPEYFLADGIIELGIIEDKENVKRYIQIRKMRGADHSMEKHHVVVGKEGISILGSVY